MTWKISSAFVALATVITILVGWLTSVGLFPIHQTIGYSDAGVQFIRVWLRLAIAIGLILPIVAFVIWFKRPEGRRVFGFYLLLLVIQIITEQIVAHAWLSSLVVIIGTLYTAFRVWQLWRGLHLLKTTQPQPRLMSNVLWLLLLFWLSNFIMLLTLSWPGILIYK